MKPLVAGVIALCTALPLHAQTYKWVDENGRTHYSATPPAASKAKVVEDRISVVPVDPDLERQGDALRKREARRAKDAEAEYQRRQQQAAAQPAPYSVPSEHAYADDWWGGGYEYYLPVYAPRRPRPPRPAQPIARPIPRAAPTQVR